MLKKSINIEVNLSKLHHSTNVLKNKGNPIQPEHKEDSELCSANQMTEESWTKYRQTAHKSLIEQTSNMLSSGKFPHTRQPYYPEVSAPACLDPGSKLIMQTQ